MTGAMCEKRGDILDMATRAVLQDQTLRFVALMRITEGPHRPLDEWDVTLFAKIRLTFRHIAQHGPSAMDVYLARQATMAGFQRFMRKLERAKRVAT